MASGVIGESQFVEMEDSDLIALIGSLWEHIKTIDEKMKSDGHIQRVEEELKEYKLLNYVDEQKAYKLKLKASRAVAKARGLRFTLPVRSEDEEQS